VADWWVSLCTLVSSTNKTVCHDITEILLKMELSTIPPPLVQSGMVRLKKCSLGIEQQSLTHSNIWKKTRNK